MADRSNSERLRGFCYGQTDGQTFAILELLLRLKSELHSQTTINFLDIQVYQEETLEDEWCYQMESSETGVLPDGPEGWRWTEGSKWGMVSWRLELLASTSYMPRSTIWTIMMSMPSKYVYIVGKCVLYFMILDAFQIMVNNSPWLMCTTHLRWTDQCRCFISSNFSDLVTIGWLVKFRERIFESFLHINMRYIKTSISFNTTTQKETYLYCFR